MFRHLPTWLAALVLTGCVSSEPVQPLAEAISSDPSGLALAPIKGLSWQANWTEHVALSITRHSPALLTPSQEPLNEIVGICPGFATAAPDQRLRFWALFLAAVTRYESGFDPNARFQEGWKDPETGHPQMSEGLLQLSYSDRAGHKDCRLDRAAANITDPAVNLDCGVAILRKQLAVKKTLFPGPKPYYWSVLTNPKVKPKLVTYLTEAAARQPFCQVASASVDAKP